MRRYTNPIVLLWGAGGGACLTLILCFYFNIFSLFYSFQPLYFSLNFNYNLNFIQLLLIILFFVITFHIIYIICEKIILYYNIYIFIKLRRILDSEIANGSRYNIGNAYIVDSQYLFEPGSYDFSNLSREDRQRLNNTILCRDNPIKLIVKNNYIMYKDDRSNQATKYLLFKKFGNLDHKYNQTDIEKFLRDFNLYNDAKYFTMIMEEHTLYVEHDSATRFITKTFIDYDNTLLYSIITGITCFIIGYYK